MSEPNYHSTKWCSEKLLAIAMNKTKLKMKKTIYLGISILENSQKVMHEFRYDHIKQKHQEKTNLI